MAGHAESMKEEQPECLDNCCSIEHGNQICAISSAARDINAVPLWTKKCSNYANVVDEWGRSALMLVASTGNVEALEWLIKRAGANIDKKDKMSGHTALHRSIYFGNIHVARSLIKFNADTYQKDNEGMTAFELCNKEIKDYLQKHLRAKIESDPTELLLWGTNDNYTLGNINKQERLVPEQLEVFRKNNTQIMKVAMSTYHSVFLSQLGELFVCGSGRLGILGNGYDKSVLQPEPLNIRSTAKCVSIAAGANHTLFLMENGRVLSCGSNEYGISGQKESVKQLLVPKTVEIPGGRISIEGIIAARYHSVFYTSRKLFTCGLNRGQLGHSKDYNESVVFEPKMVSQIAWDDEGETKFTHFAASTCATVARASTGIIYVFHKFEVIKINAKQFDVVKMQAAGGSFNESHVDKSMAKLNIGNNNDDHLIVLLLTSTGRIIIWRTQVSGGQNSAGSVGIFSRVIFNSGRVLDVCDVFLSQSCLLFVTSCGEAYKSVWKPMNEPSYVSLPSWERQRQRDAQQLNDFQISTGSRRPQKGKDLSSSVAFLEHMKIQKIKNVYSSLCITADEQGKNFGIIQSSPKTQLTCLPAVSSSQLHLDMLNFLNSTSEEDTLHDVVLKVGNRRFPAHMYIIASGCPKLHSIVVSKKRTEGSGDGQTAVIPIEDVDEIIFEQILQFVYSHTCDLLTVGKKVINIRVQDLIKSTMEAARRLELENFCKVLKKFILLDGVVCLKPMERQFEIPCRRFVRSVHEDLSDIILQSQDSKLFKAHRCILVSRSEYFFSMLFANLWLEQSSMRPVQLQFSSHSLEVFLDFVYEDAICNLPSNDFDLLAEILVMSDNLFLERLRTLVEAALAELLSLKNITSMIYLADRCNAIQLKETCMQFIVMNLALVLETRLLDPLPLDLVKNLSTYYREIHPFLPSRRIGRLSNAPSESEFEQGMLNMSPELANEIETLSQDDEVLVRKSTTKCTKSVRKRIRSRLSESDHNIVEAMNNNSSPATFDNSIEKRDVLLSTPSPNPSSRTSALEKVSEADIITTGIHRKPNFPNPSQTMRTLRKAEADEAMKIRQKLNPSDFPSLDSIVNNNSVSFEVWSPLPKKQGDKNIKKPESPMAQVMNKSPASSTITTPSSMPVTPKNATNSGPKLQGSVGKLPSPGGVKKKTKWKSVDLTNSKEELPSLISPQPKTTTSRDPKNPWKIEDVRKKVVFQEIIRDEVEKKENLERAITKPLNLMQIEDHAINQLTARYHSPDVEDGIEIVTVERVEERNFAPPTWVQHSPYGRNN